jgi:hypothetical protein
MNNEKPYDIIVLIISVVALSLAVAGLYTPLSSVYLGEEGGELLPPDTEERSAKRIGVLCATEGDNCVESWNGSDIVVYSDQGSSQTFAVDGATGNITANLFDVNGVADGLVIDADGDTTLSAPTDDVVDFEIGGSDLITFTKAAAADAATTTSIQEIIFTSPVDTSGTNTHNALNIDLAIGNASGGTNSVNAIAIDNITGDAQVTEVALLTGTGYDLGIDVQGTQIDLDADGDTSITADTDDTIHFEVGGADHVTFTSSSVTFADDVIIDDTLTLDIATNTSTGSQTITPTTTYLQLNPASTLTATLATGSAVNGDLLILHNIHASSSVVVVDTGATQGGGNITLGANDLAVFIYGNTKWIEIASPDNS